MLQTTLRPLGLLVLLALAACAPGGPDPAALAGIEPAAQEPALRLRLEERIAAVKAAPKSAAAWGALGATLDVHDAGDGALACYAEAEALDPRDWRWPAFRGLLSLQGDRAAARAHLERAATLAPERAALRQYLGDLALADGDAAAARTAFEKAVELDPAAAHARLGLGKALLQLDLPEEARAALAACLERKPLSEEVHVILAEVHRRLGNDEAAAEEAAKAPLDWIPEPVADEVHERLQWDEGVTVAYRRKRSAVLAGRGELDAILAEWSELERIDPASAVPHAERADVLARVGRTDAALEAWARVAELAPDDTDLHFRRGNSMAALGRTQESIEAWTRTLELDPEHHEARGNLGGVLFNQGRRDEGIAALLRAAEGRSGSVDPWINLARAYETLEQPGPAAKAYGRALSLDPQRQDLRFNRARSLAAAGAFSDAAAEFELVLAATPESVSTWINLAQVRRHEGDWPGVLATYTRAVEANPTDSRPLMRLAWTYATAPDDLVRDGAKAVHNAQQVMAEFDPLQENPFFLDVLSAAAAEHGDFTPAVSYQKQAIEKLLAIQDDKTTELRAEIAREFQQRLESYQAKKPWRDEEGYAER